MTNKKKKKTTTSDERTAEGSRTETTTARSTLSDEINVMKTLDNDLELPSTSGLIKGFQFGDDANYDMSIMLDIDEFSDFQLLSPNKEDFDAQDDVNDAEQFSIIDATGKMDIFHCSTKACYPIFILQIFSSLAKTH